MSLYGMGSQEILGGATLKRWGSDIAIMIQAGDMKDREVF